MEYMKDKYSLELIIFNDEHFMMMGEDRFKEFCKKFKSRINLPFFMQTRAESLLDEKRVKALKEIKCATIGMGLESGSERIRREVLNKNIPNHIYKRAFANCKFGPLPTL